MLCEKYAVICLETLNLKGMARRWGRKVHSLGVYSFVEILKYEAMKLGTQIIFVDRYFPSSQLCREYGYKTLARAQGSLIPEAPAFMHGEYVKRHSPQSCCRIIS